ncbi:shikimate dehydrogenase [Brevibacterium oceani]|uniref:shikimate dehydrogenase n=1 Tax=Brevibacterium oceani TaxID=358099 RepID=UPI0015E6866F|nr:shikimate dehydrogenase [Brevibacterium oceani]
MTESSTLLGLIGTNVAGSLTPPMHEAEALRHGFPLVYRPLDPTLMRGSVTGADGEPDWPALVTTAIDCGYSGFNVTHPAKRAVIPAVDELDEDAGLLGAVNTMTISQGRLIGRNTDHGGFAEALASIAVDPTYGSVVQIGAGGAGAAVAYALLKAGVPELTVIDIDPGSAESLKARLSAAFDSSRLRVGAPEETAKVMREAVGLVNATPIGMTGVSDASPIALELLRPDLWVGDVIYRPQKTTLIQAAEARGCRAFGGARMAVGQAAASFELFTGRRADPEQMLKTFDRLQEHAAVE